MSDSPELLALIEKARNHVMTPEEERAQTRSFIIGQIGLAHPEMERAEVEALVDRACPELAPPPPPPLTLAEQQIATLTQALRESLWWHESEDKALSKSGRGDSEYYWRRNRHAEEIRRLRNTLGEDLPYA